MKKELIRLEHIRQTYVQRTVLLDGWIMVREGECTAIAGFDGSGRGPLVKVMAGLETEEQGRVFFRGSRLTTQQRSGLHREVAYITHQSGLVDELSIIDNLFIINRLPRKPWLVRYGKIKAECQRIIDQLEIRQPYYRLCERLEDNEKQRLEIIQKIMAGAKVIILNCIGNTYSRKDRQLLKELLDRTKKEGISYVFVTNEIDHLIDVADRIVILRKGRTVKECRSGEFNKQQLYMFMSGRRLEADLTIDKRNMVSTREVLSFHRVETELLRDLSFQIRAGEILGILSRSSRWAEELMRVLMGEQQQRSGDIFRNEKRVRTAYLKDRSSIRNKTCILPGTDLQQELFPNLTPMQNYLFLSLQKVTWLPGGMDLIHRGVGKYLQYAGEDEIGFPREILEKDLTETGLTQREQYNLVMGRIRLFNPELLILNNPLEVVDIFLKKQIAQELCDAAARGTAVLITGANYEELVTVCDRILVEGDGTIRGWIGKEEFQSKEYIPYS